MKLLDINNITDINQGDTLIITGSGLENEVVKAEIVKVSDNDGTEIIFNRRLNKYFNLGMYLEGRSWVKEVKKLQS